ncbi:hypothetical protein ACFCXR_16235 [Streptomyces noursei]|uniref:hypothetical protein n=1 Tax=Streptomyces noursei TaxID=1971 RepID=UPI0035E30F8C
MQAETHLPFAGLHQLTHTMTDRVAHLPPAQADALLGAFGMAEPSPRASAPRFFMIALATLSLVVGPRAGTAGTRGGRGRAAARFGTPPGPGVHAGGGRPAGACGDGTRPLERLERQGGYDVQAAATLGTAATMANAYDRATGFLRHAAAGLRGQCRLGLLAQTLVFLAFSTVHTVDWETGLPAVAEAMRLAEEHAQPRWLTGARIAKAQFAALHGDLDTALAVIGEAERQGLSAAHPSNLAFIQITRGLIGLAAGDHAEAFHCVWRVFDPVDPAHHPFLRTIAIAELAEAATGAEQRALAKAASERLAASAGASGAQLTRINLAFAHALLADDEHAEEHFRAALDLDMSRAPLLAPG